MGLINFRSSNKEQSTMDIATQQLEQLDQLKQQEKQNKLGKQNDIATHNTAIDNHIKINIDSSTQKTGKIEQLLTDTNSNANSNIEHNLSNSTDTYTNTNEPKIYYLMILGERIGPLAISDIHNRLSTGKITADTMIWRKGMPSWRTIEELSDIDLSYLPQ